MAPRLDVLDQQASDAAYSLVGGHGLYFDTPYTDIVNDIKVLKVAGGSNEIMRNYIARRVLPEQATRINALGEPAITLQREPERLYPNLDLAAHVIGYTDIDGHGRYGMEIMLPDDGHTGRARPDADRRGLRRQRRAGQPSPRRLPACPLLRTSLRLL